jgi:hypothetical protein
MAQFTESKVPGFCAACTRMKRRHSGPFNTCPDPVPPVDLKDVAAAVVVAQLELYEAEQARHAASGTSDSNRLQFKESMLKADARDIQHAFIVMLAAAEVDKS